MTGSGANQNQEVQVDVGGATLRAIVEGKQGAPWLVMSHSILTDLHVWDAQAEALSGNFRILRFETRGHGGSTASPPPYDFALLVADTVKVLDHFAVDKAHFMGVSLGGMIGYGVALGHPQRLASLIATSSRADAPDAFRTAWDDRIAAVKKDGMEALVKPTIDRWFSPEFVAGNKEKCGTIGDMIRSTSLVAYEGTARALQHLDYLKDLGKVRTPTLLIAGALDLPIPADMAKIQELISGSQFEVVADAGHLPNVEKTAEFNRIVSGFLGRLSGK